MSSCYSIRSYGSVKDIAPEVWGSCHGTAHPVVHYGFLSALEDSGCLSQTSGWHPHPVLIYHKQASLLKAAVPLYIKEHSQGEYIFDHHWADAAHAAGIAYYPKALAASPFTPITSRRLLTTDACAEDEHPALLQALAAYTQQLHLSSLHLNFLPAEQARSAEQADYLTRLGIQFHWYNDDYRCFDDFLARLPSRKRKNIKKERQKCAALPLTLAMEAADTLSRQDWRRFYRFYRDTIDRHYSYAYLTEDFFPLLAQRLSKHVFLATARDNSGRLRAAALHLCDDKRLYGRYWGAEHDSHGLHFELCYYQAIEYAIAHRLHTVEAGAQGGHKWLRGYEPTLTYSSHYLTDKRLFEGIKTFLAFECRAITKQYHALKKQAVKKNR